MTTLTQSEIAEAHQRHVEVLAAAAREVVESHRIDESWDYTLPDEYQDERRDDPWLR
jgi:hypothetical protein